MGLARALELGVDALCVSEGAPDALWEASLAVRKERNEREADEEEDDDTTGDFQSDEDNDDDDSDDAFSDNNGNESKYVETAEGAEIVTGKCWRHVKTKNPVVLADRLCVDLVQKLLPTEGCWIGSSTKTMALIPAEEVASGSKKRKRPNRINAGPVHSYILMSDNETKYLSELQPSDTVLVYNSSTQKSRAVEIKSLQEEVSPCVVVELESSSEPPAEDIIPQVEGFAQVFLQEAETVRLGQEKGGSVRVTDLDVGEPDQSIETITKQPVLLRIMSKGTNVGKVCDGTIIER